MKVDLKCCLFFLLLPILGGCAHLLGKTKGEEALRKKVNQEWAAKVKGDWGAVYDLTTREFKQQVKRDQFIQGANLNVINFSVKEILLDAEQGKAQVTVSLDINQMGGLSFKGAALKEEWLWEDGEWRLNLPPLHTPFRR